MHEDVTSSNVSFLTRPPRIAVFTLDTKRLRSRRRSSAASRREIRGQQLPKRVMDRTRLHTFVQWIVRIWLKEQILQADHDRVEVEDGLPVLSENVQAHISLEVDIRVVYLHIKHMNQHGKLVEIARNAAHLRNALDLWRLMRVVGIDVEGKVECAALVHAWQSCARHA